MATASGLPVMPNNPVLEATNIELTTLSNNPNYSKLIADADNASSNMSWKNITRDFTIDGKDITAVKDCVGTVKSGEMVGKS